MLWHLLPHATACLAADRLILLDLRQDRYFAVPMALRTPMLDWLERSYPCEPPEAIARLLAQSRILRDDDGLPTNALRQCVPIPDTLARPAATRTARPGLHQTSTIAATWLRLRLKRLHTILADRAAGTVPIRAADAEAVSDCAARYDAARPLTPIARNCLLDSLALDRLLKRRGLGATLVFGVCPTPFSAHCWLQTPELILNDSFDHVSRFTPIYAA